MSSPFNRLSGIALSFTLLCGLSTAATDVLVHRTTAENIDGHLTRLNDPSINGRPDRLLFLTQRFGTYNPHEVGVWYDPDLQQWTIYNEDAAKMPVDTEFNVLAVDAGSAYAFTHTVTPSNSTEYYTMIAHPSLDHNPGALVLTTPNFSSNYVPSPIGVWYTGTEWSIFRQDKKTLEAGTRFNVLVVDGTNLRLMTEVFPNLTRAFVHQATPAVTRGNLTFLPGINRDEIIFATHNWGETGPYNNHVFGVWHNAQTWTLLNHDRGSLAPQTRFNVVSFSASSAPTTGPDTSPSLAPASPPAAAAVSIALAPPAQPAWAQMDFINRGAYVAHLNLEYMLNGTPVAIDPQVVQPGQRARFQLPDQGTSLVIIIGAESIETSTRKTIFKNTYPTITVRTITLGGTTDSPSLIER